MNALTFLNNFEREFARPFFTPTSRRDLINEIMESKRSPFSSELTYDDKQQTWTLMVELAGVAKENVKIDMVDNNLVVKGEKTKGFNRGEFEIRYAVPEGIDEQKIDATFEDGILAVSMPLSEKKSAKTIQIK